MAFIDYGAISFVDGKCIQKDMFNDMKESVGWSDADKENHLDGNYFAYLGDKDFTVCFYKCSVKIYINNKPSWEEKDYKIWLNCSNYIGWKKYKDYFYYFDSDDNKLYTVQIVIKNKGNSSYDFKMNYKGHKYRCVFGYGIDYEFYKKTGRYNYYSSPEYKLSCILYKIKSFFKYKIFRK